MKKIKFSGKNANREIPSLEKLEHLRTTLNIDWLKRARMQSLEKDKLDSFAARKTQTLNKLDYKLVVQELRELKEQIADAAKETADADGIKQLFNNPLVAIHTAIPNRSLAIKMKDSYPYEFILEGEDYLTIQQKLINMTLQFEV